MDTPFDLETLLSKYVGGQIPPLVNVDTPQAGLINSDLLKIYHSGIRNELFTPLGILLPSDHFSSPEEKWQKGNFRLNEEWSRPHWSPFCNTLRGTDAGNAACEQCDKRWAIIAEQKGSVIAYLCDHGMIDFAMPISCNDQVVAIIFCGQFKPKEGSVWNAELMNPGGLFRPLNPEEIGTDIWTLASLERIRKVAQKTDLPEEELINCLFSNDNSRIEISPQQVETNQATLRKVATQISNLAQSTYELEKSKVVDQIRNRIAASLEPLRSSEDSPAVYNKLSDSLAYMVKFFALDYCLICSHSDKEIKVLSRFGLSKDEFPIGKTLSAANASYTKLKKAMRELKEPISIVLRDYKDLPIFDRLHRQHKISKQQVIVIPLEASESVTLIMILGRFKQETGINDLEQQDSKALQRFVEAIALVAKVILLVEDLEAAARKQAQFLEDVAHNIRTPIQNIIIETDVLARGLAPPESIGRRAQRLAAQVRRLHLLSQRAWTLINIDRGLFKLERTDVNVYQTIMEHRKSLLDLATSRGIQISVDRELENWPPIRVNSELFSQAVLNLLDNAIKYSWSGTETRIDGKRVPSDIVGGKSTVGGVVLSFVNRGIPVKEEEKKKIFDRYYRTTEAKVHIQTGTGIGLAIVKAFADYHEGTVEVNSVPVPGTQDYVTEFKIFIPHRGAYHV